MHWRGNGQLISDSAKFTPIQLQRLASKLGQSIAGDVSGNKRMSIAVATDPQTKTNARTAAMFTQRRKIEPCLLPRILEIAIDLAECFRENFAQIEQRVAQFAFDGGAFSVDLSRAPQGFHRGQHFLSRLGALVLSLVRCLQPQQLVIQIAVPFANTGTLRLGRVSGEDRFDTNVLHRCGDVVFAEP